MAILTNQTHKDIEYYFIFSDTSILVKEKTLELPDETVFNSLVESNAILTWISETGTHFIASFLEKNTDIPKGYELTLLVHIFAEYDARAHFAARARSLMLWKLTMNYCSSCAGELIDASDETALDCKKCSTRRYPSFSPAIIVLIKKGNKVLLAKHANRATSVYTCLAGYVEQGETLEECVKREVFEEVALKVKNVQYIKSQAWPFPNQIMFGFTCDWESGEIVIDETELESADWYSRDNFPEIPRKGTIAYALITETY